MRFHILKTWIKNLEKALYDHRFALLWAGHIIASLSVLGTVLWTEDPAYVIKDVLISYQDGLIQRGLGGTIAIWLANTLGNTPAFWAWGLVFGATTMLFILTINLYRRLPDSVSFMPLILAPSGLLFFAHNFHAAFRKETFGYLAIALILSATISPTKRGFIGLIAAGTLAFFTALFFHEVNLFLWPAFGLALALAGLAKPEYTLNFWLKLLAGLTLVGGGMVFWVLELQPRPDSDVLCAAARLKDCSSAYVFLSQSVGEAMEFAHEKRSFRDILFYLGMFALGLLPFAFIRLQNIPQKWLGAVILGLVLAVSPLFVIASDWGRWVHMILFPLNMLAVTALVLGFAKYQARLSSWIPVAYVLLWSLPPIIPVFKAAGLPILAILAIVMGANWLWHQLENWLFRRS